MIAVRQQRPLGLGHAVWCAREAIGDEPFAVLLPDDLILAARPCLAQMVEAYAGGALVAAMPVPREEVSRYGVIDPGADGGEGEKGSLVPVAGMVEKPRPEAAPSNLAVIGRLHPPAAVIEHLAGHRRGAGGEIQLTDAIAALVGAHPVHGYRFAGERFDCGAALGLLEASLVVALARPRSGGRRARHARAQGAAVKIVVVGAGYVGLVSGACFSEFGIDVTCVDNDAEKVARLDAGDIPIYEPGLEELVARNARAGRFAVRPGLDAVADADAVFIAVGTPSRRGDGHADLRYVFAAAREVAARLARRSVIVVKSTVPVGTAAEVERVVGAARPDLRAGAGFDVASNPEFLGRGRRFEDFMRPDRVVIGAESDHAREALGALYRPLYIRDTPFLFASRETAELTKYAANAFLAARVAFIDEIADLCERGDRRRRPGRRPRHRPRPAHRRQIPPSRPGLRRQLLPQGHAGAGAHRQRDRRAAQPGGNRRRGERRPQGAHGRPGAQGLRRIRSRG